MPTAGLGGRPATRLGLLAALSIALVTVTWAPAAPATATTAAMDGEASLLQDPPWHAWRTETVDRRNIAINTEIATSPQGKVWITHGGESAKPLELVHREEGGWSMELIPDSTFAPRGIAVDDGGRPWVAWSDLPTATVAARNASDDWWHVSTPTGQKDPKVDFGPDGRLHVLAEATDPDGGDWLNHSSFDPNAPGDGWSSHEVTKGFNKDADIAIGPDGTVHAVWEHNNDDARHAEKPPNGSWQTTKTSLPHCDWGRNALDVDDQGRVHVACKANSKGLMYHLRDTDGTWSTEVANDGSSLVPSRSANEVAFDTDLEVDDAGRPHIVYRTSFNSGFSDDPFNPQLPIYTVKLDDGWHTKTIDRDGTAPGREVSLALDGGDRPQVGYMYNWRVGTLGCAANPCDSLRFAEPWAATLDRFAEQAPFLAAS